MNRKTLRTLALFVFSVLTVISCTEKDPTPAVVEEGQPVISKFSIAVPAPEQVLSTKADDAQETRIEKLALLFYKSNNSKPVILEVSIGDPQIVTSTNYIYDVSFSDKNITSGDWYLYAIANYDRKNYGNISLSHLAGLTKDQMDQYIVLKENDITSMNENSVLLTGKFGTGDGKITLVSPTNDFTENPTEENRIHLRRIFSKVKFTIKGDASKGVTFKPISYSIYNYSVSSTLFERHGWAQQDGKESYKYGTFPGTLAYAGKDNGFIDIVEKDMINKNSFEFYMLENVQKSKSSFPSQDEKYREVRDTDNDPTNREFKYAPENATYIVINGQYTGPGLNGEGTVSGNVSYTVHLGNISKGTTNTQTKGSADNFTVRRNTKYQYEITISGVNNIITEATTNVEGQPGAEGDIISNETGATDIRLDAHYETVMIKLPKTVINGYTLKVKSPYNNVVYTKNNKGFSGTRPTDYSWIEFARPASASAFVNYYENGSKNTCDIFALLDELAAPIDNKATNHYFVSGNYIYVQAFVKEYFYEGKPLKEYINAPDRELTLASIINISSDNHSSYATGNMFSIKQRSIKSMFDVSTVANPFGVESVEEYTVNVTTVKLNKSNASDSDGWSNFASVVKNNAWTGSGFIPEFKTLGHFDNSNIITKTFNSDLQCLSRNRDENGNGIIDEEEIKWFLPSHDQYLTMWNGYPALDDDAEANDHKTYFSSSYDSRRIWWAYEGASFGRNMNKTEGIRCIRALGAYNQPTTSEAEFNPTNNVVKISGFGPGAITPAGSTTGEYLFHLTNADQDKLPSGFKIAKDLLTADVFTMQTVEQTIYRDKEGHSVAEEDLKKTYTCPTITASLSGTTLSMKISNYDSSLNYLLDDKSLKQDTFTQDVTGWTYSSSNNYTPSNSFTVSYTVNKVTLSTTVTVKVKKNGGSNYKLESTSTSKTPSSGEYYTVDLPEGYTVSKVQSTVKVKTGQTKSEFTTNEVQTGSWCQDSYYEESDKSDLGLWRIPNEREYGLMFLFLGSNLETNTSTRTSYARGDVYTPYYVNYNRFITTSQEQKTFKIRCVRDYKE